MKCRDDYTTFINEIIAKGYAEDDVSKEEASNNNGPKVPQFQAYQYEFHGTMVTFGTSLFHGGVLPQEAWQDPCRVRLQCTV